MDSIDALAGIRRIGLQQLHRDAGCGLWEIHPPRRALFYDVLLNSRQGKSIEYLGNLYQSDAVLLAKGLLTKVITLSLRELLFGVEEVLKFSVVLPTLVFEGESKVFTVAVKFHLIPVAVDEPTRSCLREIAAKHLLEVRPADALSETR
jgi:hypothetical protein